MKRLLLLIILLAGIVINSYAQFETSKQTYKSPDFETAIARHKVVAILPLKVTISYRRMPKDFDVEGNKLDEQKQGINMQQGMYTYLLRKAKSYSVEFQDVERTNALLRSKGVLDKVDEMLQDSLCALLGVDAVIKCSYAYEKTGSEAGAIAKTLLFGVGGKTGSGALTMQVYDHKSGKLLWRFYKEMNETAFSNANELMERMMRKVSRNFPYEK